MDITEASKALAITLKHLEKQERDKRILVKSIDNIRPHILQLTDEKKNLMDMILNSEHVEEATSPNAKPPIEFIMPGSPGSRLEPIDRPDPNTPIKTPDNHIDGNVGPEAKEEDGFLVGGSLDGRRVVRSQKPKPHKNFDVKRNEEFNEYLDTYS